MAAPEPGDQQIRVLLFGLGAIGGFYAFILSRCKEVELSVIARSNYAKVKEEGLIIDSLNHGRHRVYFNAVYSSPTEAVGTYDYIVCCNKATNPTTVPPQFLKLTNASTTFVVIQNGVGNEEYFQKVYPGNTTLSCVIWVHAIQSAPNVVTHMRPERTELGLHRNLDIPVEVEQSRLQLFNSLMISGGTNVSLEPDIQVKRWEKVVWNIAWNPITMLTMVDTKEWLSRPEAVRMTRRLFTEAIDVGRAAGVALRYELVDELMDRIAGMSGISASMASDAKHGRPLELDVILGVAMRKARELDIDVPTLAALFALTEAVHGRICAQCES